jgi:hypothetical protein
MTVEVLLQEALFTIHYEAYPPYELGRIRVLLP